MLKALFLLVLISSCASRSKEVIQGYSAKEVPSLLRKLEGKTRQEALKILGTPAIAKRCKFICGPKETYRMIYLTKDMDRFYFDLLANTDEKVDCLIFDFYPDYETKKYVFKKDQFKRAKNCNNKEGEIQFLQNYGTQANH